MVDINILIYDSKIIQKNLYFMIFTYKFKKNLQINNTFIEESKKNANFKFWLHKT